MKEQRKKSWTQMQKEYLGRKFKGKLKGKQRTIKVVDITLGGDVVVARRRGFCGGEECLEQEAFLKFVKEAKEEIDHE